MTSGRAAEAVPILERVLAAWPRHRVAWTNLVVAYAALGEWSNARQAAGRAEAAGVELDHELLESVRGEQER